MTRINFVANLCLLMCSLQNNIVARTSDTKIWNGNITKDTLLPDYLLFSLESTSRFDYKHTDRHVSVEKGEYDKSYNVVTHVHGVRTTSSGTQPLASVNTFDDLTTSLPSPHFHLDLQECANHSHIYLVKGSKGSILISLTPTDDSQTSSVVPSCTIELQVSQGMVAHVRTLTTLMTGEERAILIDANNVIIFDNFVNYLPTEFFTYSNIVRLQLIVRSITNTFELNMNFTAVPQDTLPQLKTTFLSSTTGYIDTSQPNESRKYPPFINTWTNLVQPEDHATVISIYLYKDNTNCFLKKLLFLITLQSHSNSTQYNACALHKYSSTEPVIFYGDVRVQYKSFTSYDRPYFRIVFSFHHVTALPVQLSEGRWNCSAVRWEDMKHHFPCNFVSNCVGGEDEAGCWSGGDTCSPGTFQVGGRCFSLSYSDEEEMSWVNAKEQCQKRGGQLPSLTTRSLWESVTDLFMRIDKCSRFFIGARSNPPTISVMYRKSWMWSDDTIAHFIKLKSLQQLPTNIDLCATLWNVYGTYTTSQPVMIKCEDTFIVSCLLCEIPGTLSPYKSNELPKIRTTSTLSFIKSGYLWCPDHHFTHVFLACDEASRCWGSTDGATDSCPAPLTPLPPFQCVGVHQSVPYTLVCDHRADCKDGSDEDFCDFPPCDSLSPFRCAGRRVCCFSVDFLHELHEYCCNHTTQCVERWERCNGQIDCDDRADEDRCVAAHSYEYNTLEYDLPLKMDFNSKGMFTFLPYNKLEYNSSEMFFCPGSHFTCVSLQQVCLPVYLRCNGVNDCPAHEDEAACDRYTCPGFYRCRASQVCVHDSHVCDGIYHCPQHDDEILCNETCPHNCVCHGWAFGCSGIFHAASYPNLRYVDASGTAMNLIDFVSNIYLVYLNLIRCNITRLHEVTLPNLRILDLSSNKLTHISNNLFTGLTRLESLKLSFNPLNVLSLVDARQTSSLKILDLSDVLLPELDFGNILFSTLTTLNLSGSRLDHVTGQGIGFVNLLDLRLCPMTSFPREIFYNLTKLQAIFSDNYKLCCPAILPPSFNVLNCHAPSDEVSSCDDLLRSGVYRAGVAIFASLALLGNLSTLVYRLMFHKTSGNVGYDVFVTNLCVADFLMGLYLSIIGIADFRYRGSYVWEDVGWRNSSLCKLAGFTSLLSCEVSVFIIFLITVDRFLVLRFPFSQVHFGKRSAQWACAVSWLIGVTLAFVPLLPMTSHWQFYSQTSICVPLPTSRVQFPGRRYAFGVIIICNFIFFILILIGQASIYWSVHTNSMSVQNTSNSRQDVTIARRLITVVMSDFLCWFPVGLTGILASSGIPISGEVNVGIAIFVLPINATVNPFLYTINIYLERRRRRREEERRRRIVDQLKFVTGFGGNTKTTLTTNDTIELLKTFLSMKTFSHKELQKMLQDTL